MKITMKQLTKYSIKDQGLHLPRDTLQCYGGGGVGVRTKSQGKISVLDEPVHITFFICLDRHRDSHSSGHDEMYHTTRSNEEPVAVTDPSIIPNDFPPVTMAMWAAHSPWV